ncbi:DNA adenine methylase [Dysgonomonas sp. HGC4]|uniref:DNA adenine methylase n=1 Tax=Dysgonomonas sp. HGC4 TaxID=1658009 RepID=UPI0012F86AD3|nr:DNA adenine methylase [Dysgonomonas sp. HGC4]
MRGKRWFVKYIDDVLLSNFNNYYKLFFDGFYIFIFEKQWKIKYQAFLSDFNKDLINAYKQIQLSYNEIIKYLEIHKKEKDDYYRIRSLILQNDIEKAAFLYFSIEPHIMEYIELIVMGNT